MTIQRWPNAAKAIGKPSMASPKPPVFEKGATSPDPGLLVMNGDDVFTRKILNFWKSVDGIRMVPIDLRLLPCLDQWVIAREF